MHSFFLHDGCCVGSGVPCSHCPWVRVMFSRLLGVLVAPGGAVWVSESSLTKVGLFWYMWNFKALDLLSQPGQFWRIGLALDILGVDGPWPCHRSTFSLFCSFPPQVLSPGLILNNLLPASLHLRICLPGSPACSILVYISMSLWASSSLAKESANFYWVLPTS